MPVIKPRDNPCYCINLRQAANMLTKYYDQAFEPLGITTSQFSLLDAVYLLESSNKSQLAQFTKLDRTTIIRGLHVLSKKKLIHEVSGENSRNNLIQLTKIGASTVKEGLIIWEQVQAKVKTALGEENIAILIQILSGIEVLEQ